MLLRCRKIFTLTRTENRSELLVLFDILLVTLTIKTILS
jgi:hypothetical protein